MRLCCLCLGSVVHFLPLAEESSLADIGLAWWDPQRTLPLWPCFLEDRVGRQGRRQKEGTVLRGPERQYRAGCNGCLALMGSIYLTESAWVTFHQTPGLLVIPQVLNLVRSL